MQLRLRDGRGPVGLLHDGCNWFVAEYGSSVQLSLLLADHFVNPPAVQDLLPQPSDNVKPRSALARNRGRRGRVARLPTAGRWDAHFGLTGELAWTLTTRHRALYFSRRKVRSTLRQGVRAGSTVVKWARRSPSQTTRWRSMSSPTVVPPERTWLLIRAVTTSDRNSRFSLGRPEWRAVHGSLASPPCPSPSAP